MNPKIDKRRILKCIRFIKYIVLAQITLCVGVSNAHAQNVRALLTKAFESPKYAFEGTQSTTLSMSSGNITSQVTVICDGHGGEKRFYRNGAMKGVETLQVGKMMWRKAGSERWIEMPMVDDRTPISVMVRDILNNYELQFKPAVNIAGRKAIPIWIDAKHQYNPSRHIWVDPAIGVILKDVLYAPDGAMRSVSYFTRLRVSRPTSMKFQPPGEFDLPTLFGPASFVPRDSSQAVMNETQMNIYYPTVIPNGYHPAMYGVMITGSGRKMPVVRYSDGLGAFTIFQRGMGGGFGYGQGYGRRMRNGGGPGTCVGNTDKQHAIVTYNGVKANYILIGGISESELKKVALSLP